MSPVGIHSTCSHALWGAFPLIWVPKVLEWHHCHHVIASSWTRQSRPLLFFSRVNNFSIVTTNACCRFRCARVDFTTAYGKVAKSARYCPLGFHVVLPRVLGINEGLLSFFFVLLTRLSARCLLSSRPVVATGIR